MGEDDKLTEKDVGGNLPSRSSIEPEWGSSCVRGHELNPLSYKALLTVVFAIPLSGAFLSGIYSYRAGLSEIDVRIVEKADPVATKQRLTDLENANIKYRIRLHLLEQKVFGETLDGQ